PRVPQCYYNRGLAHDGLGQSDRALHDYSEALRLDPKLAPAALNRAILHSRAGRLDDAEADLRRALDAAPDRGLLGQVHYTLAALAPPRPHDRTPRQPETPRQPTPRQPGCARAPVAGARRHRHDRLG